MDKRTLRQSAVSDFMQSLEHLDELLGNATDSLVSDDDASPESETANADTPVAKSTQQPMALNHRT